MSQLNNFIKILKEHSFSQASKTIVFHLLEAIYTCLTHFCKSNEANQNLLKPSIDFFLDEIEQDFGQIDLVCNIFQDNKYLCENFPESLFNTVLGFINAYGRQTRFLSLFRVIQTYKRQNLVENQIRTLNLFLPHYQAQQDDDIIDQNEFWLYGKFHKSSEGTQLKFEFSKSSAQHIQQQSHLHLIDQPYSYHSKLIDVLLQTTIGEESFKLNSPKLKNVFKLSYLIELLLEPDDLLPEFFPDTNDRSRGFSLLKRKIVLLVNWIYLNNELTHQEIIIREQSGFIKIFEMEKRRLLEFSKFEYSQRYVVYFFDSLLLLFTNFSQKMIQRDANHEYKERDDYEHLFQMVKCILDYANHSLNNTLCPSQYNNLVKFVTSVDEKFFIDNGQCLSQCLKMEDNKGSFSQNVSNIEDSQSMIKGGNNPNHHSNNLVSAPPGVNNKSKVYTIFNQEEEKLMLHVPAPQKSPLSRDSMQNRRLEERKRVAGPGQISVGGVPIQSSQALVSPPQMQQSAVVSGQSQWFNYQTWSKFLLVTKNSEVLAEESKNELRTLAKAILKVDRLVPETLKKNLSLKVEFKDILKKTIRYIEFGIINKANKWNLIYSLQLLEEILKSAENLEEMQNLYDQHQATKMILNILADHKSYPFDDEFLDQLLSFGCKLTEGGNHKVQKTIFSYFSNLSKSESIFSKINSIINGHIDQLKLKQKQQNEQTNQTVEAKEVNYLLGLGDTDSKFGGDGSQVKVEQKEEQSQDLQRTARTSQMILEKLLRFLQLFCEGHNLDLQNYLRYQFNSRNNYNLVQSIVELLYMYHFELNFDNFHNIMRCLDTLTEFVQGPCSLNQQAIIDSKFLEIANSLLNTNIEKKKQSSNSKSNMSNISEDEGKRSVTVLSMSKAKSNRSNPKKVVNPPQIHRWMLERIKYKSMVLVTSLLELNSDSLAIKRIMRSLPIECLKDNLKRIYKRYKKLYDGQYTDEALKHIDADPEDQNLVPEYHELILETGFYIYFLISYYSELDTQEIDFETSSELQDIKQGSKEKGSMLQDMKNNVLGQLVLFAYSIVKGILTTINAIGSRIQKKIKARLAQKDNMDEKEKEMKRQMNQEIFKETIQFFGYNSAHIEVVRNDQIEKIHFFKLPHCHYLPKETKLEFHENINRDSANAKISGLVDECQKIIEICKHEEKLALFFSHNKFIAIFANYVALWKDLAFLLTLLLNIFIILSFYDGDPNQSAEERYFERIYKPRLVKELTTDETERLFRICGIIMIVCSTFVVLFFLCKKAPLYVREAWNQSKDLMLSNQGWVINTLLQLFTVGHCIVKVLLNIDVMYYLAYGTLAFIATMVHPFFFAFHLSEVVIRYPTLRNIIKSFWEPKKALLLTFFLIILLNYFFTLFGYTFLYECYQGKCESMLFCFMETFDKAFKNNGGIGGWFDSNNAQSSENYSFGRFFFENLYNIVIVIIMIQIFSGIIIDTFSSLREKSLQKSRDIQEVCFVCGHSRELFDRKSDSGFQLHTRNEHYMWNYVFYISYLRDKEVTEYTGIESYIAEKLRNFDNSWFPINKALGLQNMTLDSHHYEAEKLKEIEVEMNKVKKNIADIIQTVEELEKKRS